MNIKTGIYRTERGVTVYLGKDAPKIRFYYGLPKFLRDLGIPYLALSISDDGHRMLYLQRFVRGRGAWLYVIWYGDVVSAS